MRVQLALPCPSLNEHYASKLLAEAKKKLTGRHYPSPLGIVTRIINIVSIESAHIDCAESKNLFDVLLEVVIVILEPGMRFCATIESINDAGIIVRILDKHVRAILQKKEIHDVKDFVVNQQINVVIDKTSFIKGRHAARVKLEG